jgi:hypothetical protein
MAEGFNDWAAAGSSNETRPLSVTGTTGVSRTSVTSSPLTDTTATENSGGAGCAPGTGGPCGVLALSVVMLSRRDVRDRKRAIQFQRSSADTAKDYSTARHDLDVPSTEWLSLRIHRNATDRRQPRRQKHDVDLAERLADSNRNFLRGAHVGGTWIKRPRIASSRFRALGLTAWGPDRWKWKGLLLRSRSEVVLTRRQTEHSYSPRSFVEGTPPPAGSSRC